MEVKMIKTKIGTYPIEKNGKLEYYIEIYGDTYQIKDQLKTRGFRFYRDPSDGRCWWEKWVSDPTTVIQEIQYALEKWKSELDMPHIDSINDQKYEKAEQIYKLPREALADIHKKHLMNLKERLESLKK